MAHCPCRSTTTMDQAAFALIYLEIQVRPLCGIGLMYLSHLQHLLLLYLDILVRQRTKGKKNKTTTEV